MSRKYTYYSREAGADGIAITATTRQFEDSNLEDLGFEKVDEAPEGVEVMSYREVVDAMLKENEDAEAEQADSAADDAGDSGGGSEDSLAADGGSSADGGGAGDGGAEAQAGTLDADGSQDADSGGSTDVSQSNPEGSGATGGDVREVSGVPEGEGSESESDVGRLSDEVGTFAGRPDPNNYRNSSNEGFIRNRVAGGADPEQGGGLGEFVNGVQPEEA